MMTLAEQDQFLRRRLRVLKKCVEITEQQLRDLNRPAYIDARKIIAELEARQKLLRKPERETMRQPNPDFIEGTFVGEFL